MKATELKKLTSVVESIEKEGLDFLDYPPYRIGFQLACRLIKAALKENYLKKDVDFLGLCDIINTESEV